MQDIQTVCDLLTDAGNVVFVWAMGTHQVHGVDTVRSIANLALMLGQVGRPGAGMLPLRGHSNCRASALWVSCPSSSRRWSSVSRSTCVSRSRSRLALIHSLHFRVRSVELCNVELFIWLVVEL